MKAEQARITREIADSEEIIRQCQTEYAAIEANLGKALKLVSVCGREYAEASQVIKRLFNQAFFEKFVVENRVIVEAPFTRPVAEVIEGSRVARHFIAALRSNWDEKARTLAWAWKIKVREAILSGQGLSNDALVGVTVTEFTT